ncbi:DNA-binding protein [Actinobacillus porcinus]|uniref:Mu DNA-binding domain n=1 Tax=[Actinobacillus] rossii TaxID=123820 RepID=A0A380U3P9_9PAST|nr:DNA-binding protein [Actinobacillus porcinus]MDY5421318.1 DNA-binding protein [Actinobacillus porcinus]MDY6215277.1 DNA-binding protein [Actinobacillus porcinus]SUT95104.1 Mu DNA-binding domain [[Actinobacillus] rossii]
MKEWYTLKELLDVGGLPSTPQGIILYAKKDKWRRRRVAGVKGNIFEYYVYDMPESVQTSLGVTKETLALKQELIDEVQKENEKFLNQILSDIKNILVNNGILRIREISSTSKEEEILLSYYRNSSEQDKTTILNMVERISKTSKS